MVVKVCGITNLDDALAAVDAGADALGFNFYPQSPRYIEPLTVARLCAAIPPDILKVGVFVDEPVARAAELCAAAGLDIAQLHGEARAASSPAPIRIWRALPAGVDLAARIAASPADAFLIDTPSPLHGGTGTVFDWSLAANLRARIILAGGLGPDNVAEAIRRVRPWGVDAASRLERAPGLKDHEKMRLFVKAARSESTILC
ncbi:MAG: phosphoribosylanthranilate isomerase [Bryobacteraceae bacterium]|nr:phosphoribosylanthranilate isomerase [Bryobacteraceae bacterium]